MSGAFCLKRAQRGEKVEHFDTTRQRWHIETAWFHTAFEHNGIVVYGEGKLCEKIENLRMAV